MRLLSSVLIAAALLGAAAAAPAQQGGFAPGMEAMYLRTIQDELARAGFYRGPVDGIDGPQTRQAIRDWQRAAGQPVDGMPTTQLVEALRYGPRYAAPPRPAADPGVRQVQQMLGAQGYYNGAPDGIDGPQTQDAIKQWQEDHGMQRTGQIDQPLLDSLHAATEPPPRQGPPQQEPAEQPAPAGPAPE